MRALTIARRDFVGFWWSMPNPIVAGVTMALAGIFFANSLTSTPRASLGPAFEQIGLVLVLVVPVLTMRSLAEEARTGSLDVLLTQPVSDHGVVLGKYLGALATVVSVLVPVPLYVLFLYLYGSPDGGVVAASLLGLALLVALLVGVGLLTSALTSSQIIAAGLGILGGLVLWSTALLERVPGQIAALSRVSALDRLRDFTSGTIETTDVVYFLTFTAAALYVAVRAVSARRLR